MKTIQTLIIILLSTLGLQAQNKVSIFEVGKPILSCEANFENLLNNWNNLNITNADVYKMKGYKLVEEISDSTKYNYYKNYFSGEKPVYASVHFSGGEDSNGKKYKMLFVKPGFLHETIYDPRKIPDQSHDIFTEEFRHRARNVLSEQFNIDTSSLWAYHLESKKGPDTIYFRSGSFSHRSISSSYKDIGRISVKPISQNYIDINITREKSYKDLNVTESQDIFIEEIWVHKTMYQAWYNDKVRIGDFVYRVEFMYYGKKYTTIVICSHETNRVVFNTFFYKIKIESN